jgi:glycosyltransferase involved in cell wall biosynthesis
MIFKIQQHSFVVKRYFLYFYVDSLPRIRYIGEMSSKRKLLILSDAIASSTGLARIARDLATRIHSNLSDVYEIASVGYGSPGSCKFGFNQYVIEGMCEWVCLTLPDICSDFFGKEKGTIFTIWDASRLTWLAAPRGCNELFGKFPGLQQWAMSRPFELWGYIPIDSSGPNDRLTFPIMKTLLGFDRLLAYGPFGEGVIRRTIGDEESDKRHLTNLPHGIDGETFYEMQRKLSRRLFLEYTGAQNFFQMIGHVKGTAPIADDEVLVSILGTNQSRKNFALGIETASILAQKHRIRLHLHIDSLERYWSIPNLLADFGMLDKTVISLGNITDSRMATIYSGADLVLGIAPEGFGYVHCESMACGCPCVTGSYAGGAALVDPGMLVDPIAFYYEGSYASKRPVYNAADWAAKAEEWIGKRTSLDPKYEWDNNWKNGWEPYLRKAAK